MSISVAMSSTGCMCVVLVTQLNHNATFAISGSDDGTVAAESHVAKARKQSNDNPRESRGRKPSKTTKDLSGIPVRRSSRAREPSTRYAVPGKRKKPVEAGAAASDAALSPPPTPQLQDLATKVAALQVHTQQQDAAVAALRADLTQTRADLTQTQADLAQTQTLLAAATPQPQALDLDKRLQTKSVTA